MHHDKAETTVVAKPGEREIVITRTFDAPRELVFKALTDPKLIPRWWGPERYPTTVARMDVRPGGKWRFTQRDAEGNQYGFHGVYHDIVSPERIVQTTEFEGAPGYVSLETATLEEVDGKTKLTAQSVHQSVEARDAMIAADMEEGVKETYDRLAKLLADPELRRRAA